jgi:hypothetical protein
MKEQNERNQDIKQMLGIHASPELVEYLGRQRSTMIEELDIRNKISDKELLRELDIVAYFDIGRRLDELMYGNRRGEEIILPEAAGGFRDHLQQKRYLETRDYQQRLNKIAEGTPLVRDLEGDYEMVKGNVDSDLRNVMGIAYNMRPKILEAIGVVYGALFSTRRFCIYGTSAFEEMEQASRGMCFEDLGELAKKFLSPRESAKLIETRGEKSQGRYVSHSQRTRVRRDFEGDIY